MIIVHLLETPEEEKDLDIAADHKMAEPPMHRGYERPNEIVG